MAKLTGYEMSRQWFDFAFENPEKVKPVHTALYFFAIEHYNRLGGKEKFGLPTAMTKEAIGIKSYNTYIKTFNDLVNWGFFLLLEKSSNQYSANIIALTKYNEALDKALDKAMIKHSTKHCSITEQSTVQSIDSITEQSTVQSIDSIDKPITYNNINNKPLTSKRDLFFKFFDIYDKKQGKRNAISFWVDLTEKEIETIFKHLPKYIESTPDKNFRAKPENYILKKMFNDEIIQKKEKSSAKKDNDPLIKKDITNFKFSKNE